MILKRCQKLKAFPLPPKRTGGVGAGAGGLPFYPEEYFLGWVQRGTSLKVALGALETGPCCPCFHVRDSFVAKAFPEITPYWQRKEVPRGCGWSFRWYLHTMRANSTIRNRVGGSSRGPSLLRRRRRFYLLRYTTAIVCGACHRR